MATKFIMCRALLIAIIFLSALSPFFENGESGKVVRVLDGDSFILETGLIVRMAQIDAPRINMNDDEGDKSRTALNQIILNKKVNLKYGGLKRDRLGRALAQVYLDNGLFNEADWINIELLKQGRARVHTYIDNRAKIADFWLAEREARRNGRGLWQNPKYQARFATFAALKGAENSFQLIEGKVLEVETTPSLTRLWFGNDKEKDFSAIIPAVSYELFDGGYQNILALKGFNIRVRGKINAPQIARTTKTGKYYPAHGASIWLDHPEQIEYIIIR